MSGKNQKKKTKSKTTSSNINNYNPNTGAKLKKGESVVEKSSGRTVTQGTQFSGGSSSSSAPKASTPTSKSTYDGPSIVDYLKSSGGDSSFAGRTGLAGQFGIQGYTGTAQQNTQLLGMLRTGKANASTTPGDPNAPVQKETPTETPQENPTTPPVDVAQAEIANNPQATTAQNGTDPSVQPGATPQGTVTTPMTSYAGPSIVDFLKSTGVDSSFASRKILASQNGISNYTGTAQQNTQLLNSLRSGQVTMGSSPTQTAESALAGQGGGATVTDPADPFGQAVNGILEQYGVSDSQSPQTSFSEVYKKVYEDMGITSIKEDIENFQKQHDDLLNKKNDEAVEINNNPWYTEGERISRLRKLDEKYEGRESILTESIKLRESLYDSARQDAQWMTAGIMREAERADAFNQDIIMKAIDNAETQLNATSKLTEVSPGATLYDPNTGKAVYTAPTAKQLGGSSSTGTKAEKTAQTISLFSSKFVPGALLNDGTPVIDDNGFVNPKAWKLAIADAVKNGLSRLDFIKNFGYLVYSPDPSKYGFTPSELKVITGK